MHDSISGPHLRCITSNGLLCTSCPVLVRKQLWEHVGVQADLYSTATQTRPVDGLRRGCFQLLGGDSGLAGT